MALNSTIATVTDRIIERSKPTRRRYLDLMAEQKERGINRPRLSCGNFAHGFAASGEDKEAISHLAGPNIGIVTAYNDMLSAHQPYGRYPEQMKIFAREVGATAQVADCFLVLARSGEAVREIAAREAGPTDAALLLLSHQVEIASPRRPRPLDDAVGNGGNAGIEGHSLNVVCNLMPP